MTPAGYTILTTAFLVTVAGPLWLGLASRRPGADIPLPAWNWARSAQSMLLYVLAFNLVFFVQELFLVLPKALTPGLRPTLFHNNHSWTGDHPLAALFQGTGAVATFVLGVACMWLLQRGVARSVTTRLLLVWLAFCGCLMALPQVALGALLPGSDLGMAMGYLALGTPGRTLAGVAALAVIPAIALWLTRALLATAPASERADARARARHVLRMATLPLLPAIALIVPFRVPREWLEVLFLPLVVTLPGVAWMQAGATRARPLECDAPTGRAWIMPPLIAAVALLLVFQLLLRPGIAFY